MARFKNVNWNLPGEDTDKTVTHEGVKQALLMDIRDELQEIKQLLKCHNVQGGLIAMQQLAKHPKKRWPLKSKTVKR